MQGDPGDGKTTAVLAIAAALTTGTALPESKTSMEQCVFLPVFVHGMIPLSSRYFAVRLAIRHIFRSCSKLITS